jgi:Thioredoxin
MKNAETTSAVIKVTDDTFQDLVVSSSFSKPVLVDFWAQWCPPEAPPARRSQRAAVAEREEPRARSGRKIA